MRLLLLNVSVWLKICVLDPHSVDRILAPLVNNCKIMLWTIMTRRVKQTENPTGSSPSHGWSCCTSVQTMTVSYFSVILIPFTYFCHQGCHKAHVGFWVTPWVTFKSEVLQMMNHQPPADTLQTIGCELFTHMLLSFPDELWLHTPAGRDSGGQAWNPPRPFLQCEGAAV